jgi:uncharacterized protein with NRDE domain
MCLIVFAKNVHPKFKLIFAANRDEFYNRPSEQAEFWPEHADLLAGKDLQAGGTWLGITKQGRFAAITNYRDLNNLKTHAPSRGKLTLDFLLSNISPEEYYAELQPKLNDYNGFNLLLGTIDELFYFSNMTDGLQKIESGIHGISNAILNTPWPKVEKGKQQLQKLLQQDEIHAFEVIDILKNSTPAKDEDLPDTGVGLELERILSPIFIKSEKYGTRCSSVLMIDIDYKVKFVEKFFFDGIGHFSNREFKFRIDE